jgi:hypothetical protein
MKTNFFSLQQATPRKEKQLQNKSFLFSVFFESQVYLTASADPVIFLQTNVQTKISNELLKNVC